MPFGLLLRGEGDLVRVGRRAQRAGERDHQQRADDEQEQQHRLDPVRRPRDRVPAGGEAPPKSGDPSAVPLHDRFAPPGKATTAVSSVLERLRFRRPLGCEPRVNPYT